jgi:hypothetical protein
VTTKTEYGAENVKPISYSPTKTPVSPTPTISFSNGLPEEETTKPDKSNVNSPTTPKKSTTPENCNTVDSVNPGTKLPPPPQSEPSPWEIVPELTNVA